LQVDPVGKHVLAANYSSGSVCVLPIGDDGALGDPTDFIQHAGAGVDPARQAGPHAHCTVFDHAGRYLLVADLGLDQVAVYQYDADRGKLAARQELWAAATPGAGPRHLAFHPRSEVVYVLNELDSTIAVYRHDGVSGELSALQTAPLLPATFGGENTGAAVQVSPSGKFLYASNRGDDSIAVFAIDEQDGTLTPVEHVPTQGRTPRDFAISPDGRYLIAANQDSNSLVTFKIDAQGGQLLPTGYAAEVPAPACVKVISAPPGTAV
jgi:6-phosphogluconolactonase